MARLRDMREHMPVSLHYCVDVAAGQEQVLLSAPSLVAIKGKDLVHRPMITSEDSHLHVYSGVASHGFSSIHWGGDKWSYPHKAQLFDDFVEFDPHAVLQPTVFFTGLAAKECGFCFRLALVGELLRDV